MATFQANAKRYSHFTERYKLLTARGCLTSVKWQYAYNNNTRVSLWSLCMRGK